MTWEWVAPVATGVVGVAGILGTLVSGKQGRDHAERVATEKLRHDRELAIETRVQQRKETAYVALLEMVERTTQWVSSVLPLMGPGPELELPDFPEQARIEALVNAFGSTDVQRLMEAWRSRVRKFSGQAEVVKYEEAHPGAEDPDEEESPRLILEDHRYREELARLALTKQVATELTHIAAAAPEPETQARPRGLRKRFSSPSSRR